LRVGAALSRIVYALAMGTGMRTDHPHTTLEGATVVVTRPAGISAALVRSSSRLGAGTVAIPGLSLRPIAYDASVATRGGVEDWIFTSPAAVRFGRDLFPPRRLRSEVRAYAVGEGSARALARHGIAATVPRERSDSKALLALPGLKRVRGRRIALVGAPGGLDLIAPTLRRRGAKVEQIHVYRRVPPRLTRRHFDALAAAKDPLITLLSSGEALENLVALLPPPLMGRLRRQTLVVSSARLAGIARENGFGEIVQARSAAPADLLAAGASALARHRL
jgi:uroporphyrinogen-III synthase